MGTGHLFDMVENHLPRGLVMEKVLFDAYTQVYKSVDDLLVKLTTTKKVDGSGARVTKKYD